MTDQHKPDRLQMAEELRSHHNHRRPYIAIATTDGKNINQPLQEALSLSLYTALKPESAFMERREIPPPAKGIGRWREIGTLLSDCSHLLVPAIDEAPFKILVNKGVMVYIIEGEITEALHLIEQGADLNSMARPEILAKPIPRIEKGSRCSSSVCGGGGRGCYES